ncbi:MAG: hypothetical protein K2W96_26145 [Gemmataceae bacterium]|nr:hypothetical protein [Gemmataceae bacterium]
MGSRVASLVAAAAAFLLAAGVPARMLGGDEQFVFAAVATGLSLVPGVLVLLWAGWASSQNPQTEALVVLGGTGIRMFAVLVAALALHQGTEAFRHSSFILWVGAAYLYLLAVEVALLVRAQQPRQKTTTGTEA